MARGVGACPAVELAVSIQGRLTSGPPSVEREEAMQDKIVLSSSPSDAVAVGPALLGFQPSESVVVVGLCGRRVAFCGRVDLADAQACTRDVLVAMRNSGADAVELVGYSQRPEWAALVLDGLARGPFDGAVIRQHVTDGATAWRCDRGELLDSEPFTPSLPQPECTRADTVAAVTAPRHPADAHTVAARTAGARRASRPATALLSSSTGSRPGSVWTASQKPLERCGG